MIATERRNHLREAFDRLSPRYRYNPLTLWIGRSELAALGKMIPLTRPEMASALDFGCGTGRMTKLLLAKGYRVTAYDLSPGMLAQARAVIGERRDVQLTSDPQDIAGP